MLTFERVAKEGAKINKIGQLLVTKGTSRFRYVTIHSKWQIERLCVNGRISNQPAIDPTTPYVKIGQKHQKQL